MTTVYGWFPPAPRSVHPSIITVMADREQAFDQSFGGGDRRWASRPSRPAARALMRPRGRAASATYGGPDGRALIIRARKATFGSRRRHPFAQRRPGVPFVETAFADGAYGARGRDAAGLAVGSSSHRSTSFHVCRRRWSSACAGSVSRPLAKDFKGTIASPKAAPPPINHRCSPASLGLEGRTLDGIAGPAKIPLEKNSDDRRGPSNKYFAGILNTRLLPAYAVWLQGAWGVGKTYQ